MALLERLGAQREERLRPPVGRGARARVADTVSRWLDWTQANRTIWLATIAQARTSPTPTCGASSPTSCAAPSRYSPHITPTSPRTRRGCATRSSAGPASTAPRHDVGCAGTPPARRHTSCSPPRLSTSCARSAPDPRRAGTHLVPEIRSVEFMPGSGDASAASPAKHSRFRPECGRLRWRPRGACTGRAPASVLPAASRLHRMGLRSSVPSRRPRSQIVRRGRLLTAGGGARARSGSEPAMPSQPVWSRRA